MNDYYNVRDLIYFTTKGIAPSYVNSSDVIVLNQKCIRNNKIDYSFAQYHDVAKTFTDSKKVEIGDILINSTGQGTAGRCAFVTQLPSDKTVIVDSHILIVRVDDFYTAGCLSYGLFSVERLLQSFLDGSTGQGEFDKQRLFNIILRLPHEKERQAVYLLLNKIDQKIELNNRINAELEAMAKTLYDYWFVQFNFPNEDGKPYKSSGGKMVYNNILKREIPEGWEDGKIEEVLDKVPHTIKILNKDILRVGMYPVVDQGQEYICGFTNTKESVLEVNDAHVIFGDHTTIVKLVNFDYSRGADGTQILISKEERVPNYLLYQMVNNLDLTNYGYARHFKFLKEAKIILPMANISNKYNQIVIPLYEKWRNNFLENINLSKLRDWLLPMLMNGQVTVK